MISDYFRRSLSLLISILILAGALRLIALDRYPPSLYSDEVNQGYNAFSLLLTGSDEHGTWLPVSLRSFGDWKPPLPTYLMLMPIALFDLSEFTVRLPSALLGIISVYLTYCLTKGLLRGPMTTKVALTSALFVAISPWHLHESRSAMLVMVALTTMQAGTVLFLSGLKKNSDLLFATGFFALSIYSYYGMRLITPVWLLFLAILFLRPLKSVRKLVVINSILALLILAPLGFGFLKEKNVIFGRAKTVSIFYDRGVELKLREFALEEGNNSSQIVTRFFHNKIYSYGQDAAKRFFSHLDGAFLFLVGDIASPFKIPNMGVLYIVDGFFLVYGIYLLFRDELTSRWLILAWLAVAILPASLTFLTPSHNRTFNAVFPISVIAAYGLTKIAKKKFYIVICICILYGINMTYYMVQYWRVLPLNYAHQWLYGLKEAVSISNEDSNKNKTVIFLPKTNMAYIYFLFFNHYDPSQFMANAVHDYTSDESGFEHVKQFDRFVSLRQGGWKDVDKFGSHVMIVGKEDEIPKEFVSRRISYPNGQTAFIISIGKSK